MAKLIDEYFGSLGGPGYAPETEISTRTVHPFMEGLRQSVTGLMLGSQPDLTYAPPQFWDKVQMGMGTVMGDFPAMLAGGAAGSIAGPVGAGVGAMALPEAARQALLAGRFGQEFDVGAVAKAGLIGGATGGVGRLMGRSLMRMPAELATMTGIEAGISGEVPTPGDIAANAVLMGSMHAATRGITRTLSNQGRNIATYDALKQLKENLGVDYETIKLGKGKELPDQIYPAVQTRMGRVFFDPNVLTHDQLMPEVQDKIVRWKKGGLGAEVEKEDVIHKGFRAAGEYFATRDEALAALGKAKEINPPDARFNSILDTKLPEFETLTSPEYLAKAGGFSWRPDKGNPSTGYMVGGKVPAKVIPNEVYTPEAATDFLMQHRDKLANNPRLFVGGWKEGGTGKNVFLDVSEHVSNLKEALDLGAARGEKAIFDLATGKDILVPESLLSKQTSPAFARAKAVMEQRLGPAKIYEPQQTAWENLMDRVWDKQVNGKIFPFLEKIPGVTAVRRALEPGFRGDLVEADTLNQALKQSKVMQQTGKEAAIDFGNRLATLKPEERAMAWKAMTGEMRFENLPENLKPMANEAVDIFYALGKRAADLGMMDPLTFFKRAGKYLPRFYSEYEYAQNLKKLGIKAPGQIEIKRFLERKELPQEVREALGEIKDPSYAVAKGIMQESQSIAFGEFADLVSKNPKWALSPEKALILGESIDPSWVQLPNTARYGNLKGKFVHPEIAKEMEVSLQAKSDLVKMADKLYGYWKAGKVVMSPKTWMRNALSNSVLAHLGGFPMYEQLVYLPRAVEAYRTKKGPYYEAYKSLSPSASSGFFKTELEAIAQKSPELMALPGAPQPKGGVVGKVAGKVMEKAEKVYQAEEQIFKIAKIMHNMERRGMDVNSAVMDADKWLFDYGDVTKFQEKYRSSMLGAPFATFTFKSLPRVAEAAVKTPWRFMAPMMMLNALEGWAREKFGDDAKKEEGKKKLRDDWMQGKMFGISNFPRVPVMDDFGREHYLDLTYILPWGDVAQGGSFAGIPAALIPGTHPATAQLWQQVSNYNQFTKQPIIKESELEGKDLSDRIIQQLKNRGEFLFKAAAPTPAVDTMKLIRGDYGSMDYRGREKATGVVLADALAGLKMYPVDYADQMRRLVSKLDPKRGKVAQEIRMRIRANAIRRNVLEAKGQDTSKYDQLIQEDIEQLKGLASELREYSQAYSETK